MARIIMTALVVLGLVACKKNAAPVDAGAPPAKGVTAAPVTAPTTAPGKALTWQEAVKSPDATVRAEGLGQIVPGDVPNLPPELLAALGDTVPVVRQAAVRSVLGYILQNSDSSALAKLIELAEKETSPEVRDVVLRSLGAVSHRDVVPALIKLFAAEKDPANREKLLANLAHSGDKRALPLVVEQLKLPNPAPVVFEAARRVANTALPELLKLLADPTPAIRRMATQSLGEIGDRAAAVELAKLAKDKDADVAAEVAHALALLGGADAVNAILELIDHATPRVAQAGIRALTTCRTPEEIPAAKAFEKVLKHLKAGANEVRIEAAQALGAAKLRRAVPMLREISGAVKEPMQVRVAALEALGQIGEASALPALTGLLADQDPDVRTAAGKAIRKLGKDAASASAALQAALKKGEADIDARIEYVKALGAIGAQDAVAALKELGEKDDVPLVRAEAGGSLILLGKLDGVNVLRPVLTGGKDWEERRVAANLLEARKYKDRKDEKVTPEQQALVTGITTLISDALKTEKEPQVREVLYTQLGRAHGPAALAAQREGLKEAVPFFRIMAASGLCRNGEAAGCDLIAQSLDHADASVRAEAARRSGWHTIASSVPGLKKAVDDPVVTVANAARRALKRIEGGATAAAPAAPAAK